VGVAFAVLDVQEPFGAAPPPLLTTTIDDFMSLFFVTMPWIRRAIWSAPPPVPAGTMNSTVFVGSQEAAWTGTAAARPKARPSR
jgi:hypothetical protein